MLLLLAAAGVVLPWLVVGQALQSGDLVLHGLLDGVDTGTGVVLGVVIAAAGAVQFSSIKQRCLTGCRSPMGFAARHWHGSRPTWEALRIGSAYGLSCVGCCAALMVVGFAVGMAAIVPMVALAVLMAAERWFPRGPQLARIAGAAMVAVGLTMVAIGVL